MTENMGKWPWQIAFRIQEGRMPGHRMVVETIFFPRTEYGGIILTKSKIIWDMSVQYE